MKRGPKGASISIACVIPIIFLVGCNAVSRSEILMGVPTSNYSNAAQSGGSIRVSPLQSYQGHSCLFKVGETKVSFSDITLSLDWVSAGYILPVIPILDTPSDYGSDKLKIKIQAWPEEDVITFSPDDFRIIINRSQNEMTPVSVIREYSHGRSIHTQSLTKEVSTVGVSNSITLKKSIVDAAPVWSIYTLVFDIHLKDLEEYVLIPAPMTIGDLSYQLPNMFFELKKITKYE
jgi:hypothetical protein